MPIIGLYIGDKRQTSHEILISKTLFLNIEKKLMQASYLYNCSNKF